MTGLFVYFAYGDKDKRLKFHGIQSIIYGIAVIIVYYVLVAIFAVTLGLFFFFWGWVLSLFWLLAWLFGLYIGYEAMLGHDVNIPAISDIAKNAA